MVAPLDRIAPLVQIEPSRGQSGETTAPSAAVRITLGEIDRFLENAKPGETLNYHRGFLALDRGAGSRLGEEAGEELDRVATALMAMAEVGLVHLVQRRNGPNSYTYIVVHARSNRRGSTRWARETVS